MARSLMARVYDGLVFPFLARYNAEDMHHVALDALDALGRFPDVCAAVEHRLTVNDPRLVVNWGDVRFPRPVGIAGGFLKNGEALKGAAALGPGFLQIGTLTRDAQAGNPRPRVQRLTEDRALVNAMGFPGWGVDAVAASLERIELPPLPILGNIGGSKAVVATGDLDAIVRDYLYALQRIRPFVKVVVINPSSPNTPGLRRLLDPKPLRTLIGALIEEDDKLAGPGGRRMPFLVKLSPDYEDHSALVGTLGVIQEFIEQDIQLGLIVCNTTVGRKGLKSPHVDYPGGLSGQPLAAISQRMAIAVRRELGRDVFMIASGGVNLANVNERLAVADVAEVYTAIPYGGPDVFRRMHRVVCACLDDGGMRHVSEMRLRGVPQ